jgi:tripartite-type tricarboxylate transporter receptor subunit TctC
MAARPAHYHRPMQNRRIIGWLGLALMLALASAGPQAMDFPTRDKVITLIVPFPAGGPTDRVARDLAHALRRPLGGASIALENVAGAGGSVGANKAARANPDGYTLLLHHIGMASMPSLVRNLPFNVERDFEYLGLVIEVPMTLITKPSIPGSSFKDLSNWIAQNKDKINLGHAGPGSASHLCGLLLQSTLQTEMTTIAYRGTAPAMKDLIGGKIDLMCDQTTNTTGQIEARKVKAFGVTTVQRLGTPVLRDVPTLLESGLKGFDITVWHGLYAPKGVPPEVLARLHAALKLALQDPEFLRKQQALGAVVVRDARTEPEPHRRFVAAEIARWSPIIRAAGVYAD